MEWSDQHFPRRAIDISKQKNDEQRCTNFCSSLHEQTVALREVALALVSSWCFLRRQPG